MSQFTWLNNALCADRPQVGFRDICKVHATRASVPDALYVRRLEDFEAGASQSDVCGRADISFPAHAESRICKGQSCRGDRASESLNGSLNATRLLCLRTLVPACERIFSSHLSPRDLAVGFLPGIFRLTTRAYTPTVFVYYEVLDAPSGERGCSGQEHLAPLALHRKDSGTRDREDSGFRDSSLV